MFQLSQSQKDRETGPELQPMSQRHRLDIYKTRIAAAALPFLAVVLAACQMVFSRSEIDRGTDALKNSYLIRRPTEARISRFAYAPLGLERGDDQEPANHTSRDRAERILQDAFAERPGPESRHALGRFYLAQREFDQAISLFEAALKDDPSNAEILSDIGAALLEKGRRERSDSESGRSIEWFARSLEHIEKALEKNGSLLEPFFNRALCHQYLELPRQAEDDWQRYLERDANSAWAEEARRNLTLIEERRNKTAIDRDQVFQEFLDACEKRDDERAWKIVSQNRDLTGGLITNRLLDAYLDSLEKKQKDEAAGFFRALIYVAGLESQKAGDRFVSDLVQFYRLAMPRNRAALSQARKSMKSGHEHYDKSNTKQAIDHYSKARRTFAQTGDACEATYINYMLGHSYLLEGKSEQALSIFQELAKTCKKARYRWLQAQALNAVASAQVNLRDYSAAIASSNQSLEISEEIGDTNGVMKTLVQLAVDYRFLNNHQRALEFQERNLELANKYKPEPIQSWRSYALASQILNSMGLYAAARDYQKEALHTALNMEIPQIVSRSYTSLGLIYTNRRDYDEAVKHLQLASEVADSFPEREARMDAMAYLHLHFGHLYSQSGDLDKAIESYDQAIQMYNELRLDMFGYAARKGKLLCCIARGGCESVEQELALAISLFEQNRYKILEESNRSIFFAIEQGIYDLAIDYAYSTKKDVEAAFEYSEASRSRSLRDLTTTDIRLISGRFGPDIVFKAVSEPMKLKEIQARLSGGEQILQYAVLKDRLLMWVVNSDGIAKSEEQAIASDALDEKVREYFRLVSTQSGDNPEELQRNAIELYDILIKPVEDALDKKKRLCIVPDKALNHLPFGALFSAASDKHLIEEYELIFAPGSSIYISCSQDAREKDRIKAERLLSVGDPRFDGKQFPSFDGLPSAAREAESVADYYNPRVLLTRETATETRVSSEMQRADVIHLALHAINDRDSPMRSKLLLAREPLAASFNNKADGVLEAHEIYGLNLSRAKLAVLSACRTGVERYYEGEGMVGLSRPFIARGVPLVVASLWPVDSDTTAELMIRFHNYRKSKNTSSVEALTRAQREMIESTDRRLRMPYYWASFVAIGGDSND